METGWECVNYWVELCDWVSKVVLSDIVFGKVARVADWARGN